MAGGGGGGAACVVGGGAWVVGGGAAADGDEDEDGDEEFVACAREVGDPDVIVRLVVEGMAHAAAARTTTAAVAKPINALRRCADPPEHDCRTRPGGGLNFMERPLEMQQRTSRRPHGGAASSC